MGRAPSKRGDELIVGSHPPFGNGPTTLAGRDAAASVRLPCGRYESVMKMVLTLALAMAGLAAVALGVACRTEADDTGTYSRLLSIVPDDPTFRVATVIVDYREIRRLQGYTQPREPGDAAEAVSAIDQVLGANGIDITFRDILGFSWNDLPEAALNLEAAFGLGLDDVDAALTAGLERPRTLHAVAGRFDPESVRTHLDACDACVPGEELAYAGQPYLSWGGAESADARFALPAFDVLGRGGYFVFTNEYVIRSNFLDALQGSIEASQDVGSLAAVEAFRLAAVAADRLDLIAWSVSDRTQGRERAGAALDEFAGTDQLRTAIIEAWHPPASEVRLRPYDTFAVGVGVRGGTPYTAVIVVHDSDQTAADNVARLEQRLVTTSSAIVGAPWANLFASWEVSAEGPVVTAILRGDALFSLAGGWDPLLLHE